MQLRTKQTLVNSSLTGIGLLFILPLLHVSGKFHVIGVMLAAGIISFVVSKAVVILWPK